jgi:hypothetical protein
LLERTVELEDIFDAEARSHLWIAEANR